MKLGVGFVIKKEQLYWTGRGFSTGIIPHYIINDPDEARDTYKELLKTEDPSKIYIVFSDNPRFVRDNCYPSCRTCLFFDIRRGECGLKHIEKPSEPYKYMANTLCEAYTPLIYSGNGAG